MEPALIRIITNSVVVCASLMCLGVFFFLAPTPPVFAALERAEETVTLSDEASRLTAFYERNRDRLRLVILFDDPMDDEGTRHRASVNLADRQSFTLIVGRDDEGLGGRKFTFSRAGMLVNIRAEDNPRFGFLQAEPQVVPVAAPSVPASAADRIAGAGTDTAG